MRLDRSNNKLADAREAAEEDEGGYEKETARLRSQISLYKSQKRVMLNELGFTKRFMNINKEVKEAKQESLAAAQGTADAQ